MFVSVHEEVSPEDQELLKAFESSEDNSQSRGNPYHRPLIAVLQNLIFLIDRLINLWKDGCIGAYMN